MGILSGKSSSNDNQTSPIAVVVHKLQDIVRWLNGFFTLSEEDRVKAGIYHGGEGRDG